MEEKKEGKVPVSRDPLVQGMLFDAALKDSFLLYTFQFVLSLVILVLVTVFGKSLFSVFSTLATASVIVMIMFALRLDLEAIDSGLTGNAEKSGVIDVRKSKLIKWSVYVQLGSLFLYVLGLVDTLGTSSGIR